MFNRFGPQRGPGTPPAQPKNGNPIPGQPFGGGPFRNGPPPDGDRPMGPRAGGGLPGMAVQSMIDSDLFSARDLLDALCSDFPDRTEYQLAYAQSQKHLMMHFMATGRMREASHAFEKARETLTRLIQSEPNQPKTMIELADTLSSASVRLKSLDDQQTEGYLHQAISTCEQLCAAFPSVPEYQALLANSHDKLGLLEIRRQRWNHADRAFLQATERLFDLLDRFPENRFYQISALLAANHLAEVRMQPQHRGDTSEAALVIAREQLEKAINSYARSNTLDTFLFRNVSDAYRTLARLQHEQGDTQAEQATRVRMQQIRPDPMRRP